MTEKQAPWVRFYPNTVREDLTASFPTMIAAWDHHVAERRDQPALHYFDATLTFGDVDDASDALGAAFQDMGVQRDDRIAVYLQNDPQWLVVMLAAWKVGAFPVAISPMLRHTELTHLLIDSGATVLVCLDHLYAEVAAEVVPQTPVRTVLTTHPLDLTPNVVLPERIAAQIAPPRTFGEALDWVATVRAYDGMRPERVDLRPADIGILTYTSGTTGRSKGAINLHSALVHSSTVYTSWWDLRPGNDVVLGCAPVFHITGITAGFGVCILAGVPLVILHRFDPEETLRAIQDRRATFTVAASTAYIALSNHPSLSSYDVTSLTKALSGGAAVSLELLKRVEKATGWMLRGAYGMTETTGPNHLGPPEIDPPVDPESGALSVGVLVPGCRLRIVDPDDGRELAPGEVGEIVVSGPIVVPGYWQQPEESAHAVRNGWLHTGDAGKVTEDGWLYVVDRLKDMINAGGFKVYPRDVEDVLAQHSAVREAAVVGVPHPVPRRDGQSVRIAGPGNHGHAPGARRLLPRSDGCLQVSAGDRNLG